MDRKRDDSGHTGKHGDADGEFSLDELIADFAAGGEDGDDGDDGTDERETSFGDFGLAIEDVDDAKGNDLPAEEIDADATGEYSRIISEYAATEKGDDPVAASDSAEEIVENGEDDIRDDIGEATREFVIEDMDFAAADAEAASMAGIEGADMDEPTPVGAMLEPVTAEADDGIPDLADLRASIAGEDDNDASSRSDLYEKLDLGPVMNDLPLDDMDGDTVDIPGFDPNDPLGLLGDAEPAPARMQEDMRPGEEAPDDDFLGLGSIKTGIRKGAAAEVLFDGVSMHFDDQIRAVTLAEILLAQGRRDDAADLYRRVADTGATFWVERRMAELNGRM